MPESDLLTALAEVGIGTAGFAGIVAAISSRSGPWAPLDRMRLQMLLSISLSVVVFSLLPLGIYAGLADLHSSWLVSSILFLMVHLLSGVMLPMVKMRPLAMTHEGFASIPIARLHMAAALIASMLLVLNIVSLSTAWPYLASLGFLLCSAMGIFVELLILSLLER